MALKQIALEQIQLGIHPTTKMLSIKQGDNVIHLTRDQVIGIKKLKEGNFETNIYTSKLAPRNTFKLTDTGAIIASCNDQYHEATILINRLGYKGILNYVDAKKAVIAWDKDLKRK